MEMNGPRLLQLVFLPSRDVFNLVVHDLCLYFLPVFLLMRSELWDTLFQPSLSRVPSRLRGRWSHTSFSPFL